MCLSVLSIESIPRALIFLQGTRESEGEKQLVLNHLLQSDGSIDDR